jgi:hypothetical protein
MIKVAIKHLINELAIIVLFDKMSVHFGNPDNKLIIRSDELDVKHLGFIKHYYDSTSIWSEGKLHPYDNRYEVYTMLLYSVSELAHDRKISVKSAKKIYGSHEYFVKIFIYDPNKKLISFFSSVYQDSWIIK